MHRYRANQIWHSYSAGLLPCHICHSHLYHPCVASAFRSVSASSMCPERYGAEKWFACCKQEQGSCCACQTAPIKKCHDLEWHRIPALTNEDRQHVSLHTLISYLTQHPASLAAHNRQAWQMPEESQATGLRHGQWPGGTRGVHSTVPGGTRGAHSTKRHRHKSLSSDTSPWPMAWGHTGCT